MEQTVRRVLLAGTSSGCGKTTVACALLQGGIYFFMHGTDGIAVLFDTVRKINPHMIPDFRHTIPSAAVLGRINCRIREKA